MNIATDGYGLAWAAIPVNGYGAGTGALTIRPVPGVALLGTRLPQTLVAAHADGLLVAATRDGTFVGAATPGTSVGYDVDGGTVDDEADRATIGHAGHTATVTITKG